MICEFSIISLADSMIKLGSQRFIIYGKVKLNVMSPSKLSDLDKAKIVSLILDKRPENALELLADFYRVKIPRLTVGTVRGHRSNVLAVYLPAKNVILAVNQDALFHPFVILHEWYHHIRSKSGEHRGTERHADAYAKSFIDSFKKIGRSVLS